MVERPILFSAPMVRALLAGTKTQTRRLLRAQPSAHHWETLPGYELKRANMISVNDRCAIKFYHSIPYNPQWDTALDWLLCPYGQPGDHLWVRENGWERPSLSQRELREGADTWPPYEYDAEPIMCWEDGELKRYGWKRRPSIHMPRWASRITLEVTDVRVQRLKDISAGDAMAEGWPGKDATPPIHAASPWAWYASLWDDINGAGSWNSSPWVWAVSFKVIKP